MPDQKISALSAAGALDGTEQFPLVQSAGTKRSLISAIRAWMIPSGGAAGQVLAKLTGTDYDYVWATPASGGSGDPRVTQRTGSLVRPGGTSDTGVGAGYVTPGIFNMETGCSSFGFPVAGTESPTVAANECYARPLKILRNTQITQVRIFVGATAASQTVSYRFYSNSVDGRPGVPVSEKMTLSLAVAGLVTLTLTTPVTLAPGLYWVLVTNTTNTATCRCVSGCGALPIYNGGFIWTGLFQAAAAARLDSADLSAQTWSADTGATNISSTRDTGFFDFTIV